MKSRVEYWRTTRHLLELDQSGERKFDYKNYKFGEQMTFRQELIDIVENLGGQLFFWMDISRWDLQLGQRWYHYFSQNFQPNKKFYLVLEEDEFSHHSVLDLDDMVHFFNKRGVPKNKIIFMSSSHNINDLIKRLNNYLKEKNIVIKYGDARFTNDERIQGYLERPIVNHDIQSFGFNSFIYNVKITDTYRNFYKTNKTPTKLFTCPMGLEKRSRVNLLKILHERKFINNIEKIHPSDKGLVSLNSIDRSFPNDVDLYDNQFYDDMNNDPALPWVSISDSIHDGWLYLNVECEIDDYKIWGDDKVEDDLFHWLERNCSRFVEKPACPMLFKKPWFNLGPVNGMKILEDYGFKSYGDVIDESYDSEEDYNKRIHMVLDEVERLESIGMEKVVTQLKPILDHNYNQVINMNTNRNKYIKKYVEEKINNYL